MTAPARIKQDEIDRVTRAVARADLLCARIEIDLRNEKIVIYTGSPESGTENDEQEDWPDDDR